MICIFYGGPDITGNGVASMLNVVDENASNKYCFNFGIFSSVAVNGKVIGFSGS